MWFPEFRPRQPFVGLALAAIAGIVIADRWEFPVWPLVASCLALAVLVWIWPRTLCCIALTFATFLTLHTIRFHHSPARAIAGLLASGPRVVKLTGIVVDEPEPPQTFEKDVTCFFPLRIEQSDLPLPVRDVRVNVAWSGAIPRYGDRITLTGSARNLPAARNPGQFDFTHYQQRNGVWSGVEVRYPEDGAVVAHDQGWRIQQFAFAARHWIQRQLELDLGDSPEITGLIQSMVLGMRGDSLEDARELFQRTGTLHLFAVSGLNVAMLAGIVLTLLRSLRISGRAAVVVTLPVLIFYAVVTGLPSSCVRATIMGALLLLAPVFDRRAISTNSICAAAVIILAWDTNQIFSPGFQFSFVLVLTIILLARRIELRVLPLAAPDAFLPRILWSRAQSLRATGWQFVASTLGVTFAAWLGSLAFTAGYFHLFSIAAIATNLLAVPIAFGVLALGVGTLLTAAWWKSVALLFNNANWFSAKLLLAVVRYFAQVPGGHIYVELPSWKERPACELTALDLRDGAAMHLRVESHEWLFDCGSEIAYGKTVLPYLRTRGVNSLDGLLLSHGDSHHIGGTLGVMPDFSPRCVLDSALEARSSTRHEIHREFAAHSFGKSIVSRGDTMHLAENAIARVLFPPAGLRRSQADDKALVVQLSCAGRRLLFMSDSGFSTEQWLLANEPDLTSDVIVKGQHAQDLSGTPDFLARVHPLAVICSALDFRHDSAALDAWETDTIARGIAVFRQDRSGAVTLEIARDGCLQIRAFLGDQTLRSRAR